MKILLEQEEILKIILILSLITNQRDFTWEIVLTKGVTITILIIIRMNLPRRLFLSYGRHFRRVTSINKET